MAILLKESMARIDIKLTSGAKIRLVPSIGYRDSIVFIYSSDDIDVAFHLPATVANYQVISNHIHCGRYSQALSEAAYRDAVASHKRPHFNNDELSFTA